MHPGRANSTLRFDQYTVDLRTGELRKNGTRIRLQEKPLRVLVALMERPGDLVTREELQKKLWPDSTFVDFETGLNTAVKKLRGALCDEAERPNYIETIPRRGYRFIVTVEIVRNRLPLAGETLVHEVDSDRDASGTPIIELPNASQEPGRPWRRCAVVALSLLVAFGFWWLTPLPDPRIEQLFPVTTSAKLDFLVRPATDGARIFYVQRAGDHYELMQSPVNGGDAQKIEAPFRNTLIWDVAPDRSHYLITSFVHRGEPSQLWLWPVTGGPPTKLDGMISGSATYSPDGKMIAFHVDNELWIGNIVEGSKRKLGTFKGSVDDPSWSPDGGRLSFTLKDADHDTMSIWEIGVDGNGLRPILSNWTNPSRVCCGSWTPDGRYFIFVESVKPSRLWALREKGHWLRRSPRGPFLLASEAAGSWSPLLGHDGRHLYFYSSSFQVDMQSLDVASRQFRAFLPVARPMMPSFSRDGRWVAYIRATTGALWRSRVDGTDARELSFPNVKVSFPRWSPDNKTLAFSGQKTGSLPNAYVVDAEGGTPQALVPGHENLQDPDWSVDGSQLVVSEERSAATGTTSRTRLVLINWRSRQLQEIPGSDGLWMPRWSPDGRWIAALKQGDREIELYDVAGNRWRTLVQGQDLGMRAWSIDSRYLYYQDLAQPGEPLSRLAVSSGLPEAVANFQAVIDSGVGRCVFIAIDNEGHPLIGFDRRYSDIYGARLLAP